MKDLEKINISVEIVQNLIKTQFPQWSNLAIKPVKNEGWDNKTFHLGEDLLIRMPSAAAYILQTEKEQRWLPYSQKSYLFL